MGLNLQNSKHIFKFLKAHYNFFWLLNGKVWLNLGLNAIVKGANLHYVVIASM